MKLDIDSKEDNKIHPQNSEKPGVLEIEDFLGNISGSDDKDYLGKNRKLIQAQHDEKQKEKMLQPHLSGNTVTAGWGHWCHKSSLGETACLAVLHSDTFREWWAQTKSSILCLRFLILRNQLRNMALIKMIFSNKVPQLIALYQNLN